MVSDSTLQSQRTGLLRSPSSAASRRTSTKFAKAFRVKRRAKIKPTVSLGAFPFGRAGLAAWRSLTNDTSFGNLSHLSHLSDASILSDGRDHDNTAGEAVFQAKPSGSNRSR